MRGGMFFMVATAVGGLLVGGPAPAFGQTADPAAGAAPATTVAPLGPGTRAPANAPTLVTYTDHRKYSPALATAGAAVFMSSYMLAVFVGLLSAAVDGGIDGPPCHCNSQIALWAIPVAGPMLGNAFAPGGNRVTMWPLAIWSGVEAAGLAMWIGGSISEDVEVPVARPGLFFFFSAARPF